MDRREALRRTALLMGGVVSAPAITAMLNGCTARPSLDWEPVFLNEGQASIVTSVAEIIIPRTDTPGAKDVGVPEFIDLVLKDAYSESDQQRFLDGMSAFDEKARKEYGSRFVNLTPEDQERLVRSEHDAAIEAERSTNPPPRPFILTMKELTMLGFFTSEAGATEVLQYVQVPGSYQGCVPLAEAGNGRTWA